MQPSQSAIILPISANKAKKAKRPKKKGKKREQLAPSSGIPIAYRDKGPQLKAARPRVQTQGDLTIVRGTELLGTLTNGANTVWAICPGLGLANSGILRINAGSESTNPWLAQVAKNFEFYRYRKLQFRYVPRVPTTQGGSVMFSPDYDAEDNKPTSEQTAALLNGSIERPPFEGFVLNIRPDRLNAQFKRHATMSDTRFPSTSQDTKTVDGGFVVLSADVSTAGLSLGKVWVDYECELSVPQSPGTTSAVTISGNGQLSANTANVVPPSMKTAIQNSINPKNPALSKVDFNPGFNQSQIGQFAKNGNWLLELLLNGTGIQYSGTAPQLVVQDVTDLSNTQSINPASIVADAVSGSATKLLATYLIPSDGTFPAGTNLLGASGNILGFAAPIVATALTNVCGITLSNTDPFAFGKQPIIDL